MTMRHRWMLAVLLLAAVAGASLGVNAQSSVTYERLLNAAREPHNYLTYGGDYSSNRYSHLTQITPANVKQMTLAWAFQTNQGQSIKATPILVNGIIYVTTVDNLWAIDARSGRQIWRHTYPPGQAFNIGHRGVAVRGDLVYLTTRDARLLALDARNGTVRWNVEIADWRRGYWCTNAPMIILAMAPEFAATVLVPYMGVILVSLYLVFALHKFLAGQGQLLPTRTLPRPASTN